MSNTHSDSVREHVIEELHEELERPPTKCEIEERLNDTDSYENEGGY